MKRMIGVSFFVFLLFSLSGCNAIEPENNLSFHEDTIRTFLRENGTFLADAFPNYAKGSRGHLHMEYYNLMDKVEFVFSYFRANKLWQKEESLAYLSFDEFQAKYQQYWQENIEKEYLPTGFVLDNHQLVLTKPEVGNYMPLYWKVEALEEDNYKLYLLNLASIYESVQDMDEKNYLSQIYSSGVMTLEDMKKYGPEVLVLKFKKQENDYILLSSDFYESYLF